MNETLRICTYNCCSLRKNVELIRELCDDAYDIIFLQETLLVEDRLGNLSFIDETYESVGKSASYSEQALTSNAGRAEGGLACLWKMNEKFSVKKINFEDKFIEMHLMVGNSCILLINVYIKSDLWEARTQSDYLDYLSQLETLIMSNRFDAIYFMGDFNADPYSGRAWNNLCEFSMRNSLKCFDFDMLPADTVTFISFGNTYCKWLDHIVGSDSEDIFVSEVRVLTEVIGSDHFPMETVLTVKNDGLGERNIGYQTNEEVCQKYVDWDNLSNENIKMIENRALCIMGNFLNNYSLSCTKLGCQHEKHRKEIDRMFDLLIKSVKTASESIEKDHRKKKQI